MEINAKQLRFTTVTVLLILVIVFCMTGTVKSQHNKGRDTQNKYYAAMEKEYVNTLRDELNRLGFRDSGITVRWISEESGIRCYTVLIHHNRIAKLDADKQTELLKALSKTELSDASCSFCCEFLL